MDRIAKVTVENGGATFTRTGEIVTTGYAVAGVADAVRIPVADFTADALAAAIAAFDAETFGTWIEEGEVWIEPSEVYEDRETADRIAKARHEIAYFNITDAEEVRL